MYEKQPIDASLSHIDVFLPLSRINKNMLLFFKKTSGQFQSQPLEHKYLGFFVGENAAVWSQAGRFLLFPFSGPPNLSRASPSRIEKQSLCAPNLRDSYYTFQGALLMPPSLG